MPESLALLLLPRELDGFELDDHARSLLSIPRVIALEPSRFRTPRLLRDSAPLRQAARLRLPGALRLVVLYHPAQYPLARSLCSLHPEAELWYVRPEAERFRAARGGDDDELADDDHRAAERAAVVLNVLDRAVPGEERLRARLKELDIINARAFLPSARFARTKGRRRRN